jgi:hypothetical protein
MFLPVSPPIYIWRQFSEVDFNMEADSGGSFNTEADFGGRFQCGGRFVRHGGRFFPHVKAKPVNLCRCSSAKGKLT